MTENCPTKQRLDRATKPLINGVPVEPVPICIKHDFEKPVGTLPAGFFKGDLARPASTLPVADPGQLRRIEQRMEKSKQKPGSHTDDFRELCLKRLTPTEYVLLLQHEIAKALVLLR